MTTTLDADLTVETFANAVRGELFDLDAEAIDDLTDGLEADLADKLADGEALGDPIVYATELRTAAGIGARQRWSLSHTLRERLTGLRSRLSTLSSNPVIAPGLGFIVSLRPVWWLARGFVLFAVLNTHRQWSAIPNDPLQLLMLVVLIVASVQWGRGRWLPWKWSRPALFVASAIAVLMAPVVAGYTQSQLNGYWFAEPQVTMNGLLVDGMPVTNIFAYGADGEPLTGVQLFDQYGNPLSVVSEGWGATFIPDDLGEGGMLLPSDVAGGSAVWNIYPLDTVDYSAIDPYTELVYSWTPRERVAPPFASVEPLR